MTTDSLEATLYFEPMQQIKLAIRINFNPILMLQSKLNMDIQNTGISTFQSDAIVSMRMYKSVICYPNYSSCSVSL